MMGVVFADVTWTDRVATPGGSTPGGQSDRTRLRSRFGCAKPVSNVQAEGEGSSSS